MKARHEPRLRLTTGVAVRYSVINKTYSALLRLARKGLTSHLQELLRAAASPEYRVRGRAGGELQLWGWVDSHRLMYPEVREVVRASLWEVPEFPPDEAASQRVREAQAVLPDGTLVLLVEPVWIHGPILGY